MQNSARVVKIEGPCLVLLSGLPGAGKSSLKNRVLLNIPGATDELRDNMWVSSDDLRKKLLPATVTLSDGKAIGTLNQMHNQVVMEIIRRTVMVRMAEGQTTIIDAVMENDSERGAFAEIAIAAGVPVKVLILDTPYEQCLENNRKRFFQVPESVIQEFYAPEPCVRKPIADTQHLTKPTGFALTSKYPFEVISADTQIEVSLPTLKDTNYDVVSDLHGLVEPFFALLRQAGWQNLGLTQVPAHPDNRKLLILGDLVDRGPQSLELVLWARRAVKAGVAVCLMGNHEKKLLKFMAAVTNKKVTTWGSYANADTGLALLKMPEDVQSDICSFLSSLPATLLLEEEKLAFVHGNVHYYAPHALLTGDLVYGQSGLSEEDSDAMYEELYRQGYNRYTVIRGHIEETSSQEHILSVERDGCHGGELVLLRLDGFLSTRRAGASNREAFAQNILTQATHFEADIVSEKYQLIRGLNALLQKGMVYSNRHESGLLRVFKYSQKPFWDNLWHESELLGKARGLVLDLAGNIVSHPFDKCFNYAIENKTGLDLPPETKVVQVEKLNGYLGICSKNPFEQNQLLFTTQGSFAEGMEEDCKQNKRVQANYAKMFKDMTSPRMQGKILQFMHKHPNITMMFEVLHPEDPHIILYPEGMHGIWLIGIRSNQLGTEPWTEEALDQAAAEMGLRRPRWARMTLGDVLEQRQAATQYEGAKEGWMVRADTPQQETLFKIKTPYYLVTKFLGRLSKNKTRMLFGNPKAFKQTIDEEFYQLVDLLVANTTCADFEAMSDLEKTALVRQLSLKTH